MKGLVFLLHSFISLSRHFSLSMMRRMVDKLGSHIAHKDLPDVDVNMKLPPSPVDSTDNHPIPIPATRRMSHYDARGSISTESTMTMTSEWGNDQRLRQAARQQRAKGAYRLTDFIIQRTLGTGSFGRVHLGQWLIYSISRRVAHRLST